MSKVSIIVNTVDRVEDLRRCLNSVLAQTFTDFEVVVVNNGVGEETRGLLEELRIKNQPFDSAQGRELRIKVVEDKTKKLSYLFNLGWKVTDPSSQYLAYLADDTEADPNWLESAVSYLDDHSEVGAVSGPMLSTANPPGEMNYLYDLAQKNFLTKVFLKIYEYLVMEGKTFQPGRWLESGAFTLGAGIPQPQIKEPIEIELLTSGNMAVRREALAKVGGFDENFLFNHADGDLFIRMLRIGYKMIFHPRVKVIHHMRFGPTRHPEILGRDTAFYYLKDVRPKSLRGFLGALFNLLVFNGYFVFKSFQLRDFKYLKGLAGFLRGIVDFFRSNLPESRELRGKILVLLSFAALLLITHRGLSASWGMLAYGDATPFPNSFSQAFQFFFQNFDPRNPGSINPQDGAILSSLIPLEALLAFLFGGGPGSFIWAQRIFHFLPIPLSFVTLYYFVSQFISSRPARFLTALIYSGNHFMVAEMAGGFEGNLYIPAFFAIFILLLYRMFQGSLKGVPFKRPLLQYLALLTLSYVLSDHVLILLIPFWLIFLAAPLLVVKINRFRYVIKNFLILLISNSLIFILSAYHAYGYLRLALPYFGSKNLPPDVIPFFVTNIWDTYWRMTLGNTLRLGGSYFSDFFGGNDFWARAGFVLPAASFSWFLFKENRRGLKVKLGLFFSLFSLAVALFIFLTSRGITLSLFKFLPLLFRFRNPSRLSLLLAFLYTPLLALTLSAWFSRLTAFWRLKKRHLFFIFLGLLLLFGSALIYYFKGFFSGDFTLSQHRGNRFWIGDRYYRVSEFIQEKQREAGPFRTAYFPWTHEETEVKLFWLDPYALGLPITWGAYVRNDYFHYVNQVFKDVAEDKNSRLGELLAEGGVKYVVLNSESGESGRALYRFDYQTPWLLGSFDDISRIVSGHSELKLIKQIEGFRVYENTVFDPKKIDSKKSGLWRGNQKDPDWLRRGLIILTLAAWIGWFWLYRRLPHYVTT